MKTWTSDLDTAILIRLSENRTTKEDLPKLVEAKLNFYKSIGKHEITKADALSEVMSLLERNKVHLDLSESEIAALKAE